MSHTATINIAMRDRAAIAAAARAVGATVETGATVEMFDRTKVSGTAVSLPNWTFPVVIDQTGSLHYDNFDGRWGDEKTLDRFRQQYSRAVAIRFARSQGKTVKETANEDGTITLTIGE